MLSATVIGINASYFWTLIACYSSKLRSECLIEVTDTFGVLRWVQSIAETFLFSVVFINRDITRQVLYPGPTRELLSLSTSGLDCNMAEEESSEDEIVDIDDLRVLAFDEEDQESPELGGYDHEFIDPVLPDQNCGVCKNPMKDAMQTECGHRFCGVCLKRSMRWGDFLLVLRYPVKC